MNLGKQIKEYRKKGGYSQESLSEKIYVSRQTISNWETDKSYPDIHNLLLLSDIFDVSLDELVKGDLELMKEKLTKKSCNREMDRWSWVMMIFILLAAISFGVILAVNEKPGVLLVIPFLLWGVGMLAALKIEQIKKQEDIKTYAEIVAFSEGKDVEIERRRRHSIQNSLEKVGIVFIFAAAVLVVSLLTFTIMRLIKN